jgi:hypothetical protein
LSFRGSCAAFITSPTPFLQTIPSHILPLPFSSAGIFALGFLRCLATGRHFDFQQADVPMMRRRLVVDIAASRPDGSGVGGDVRYA